jgi:integrase
VPRKIHFTDLSLRALSLSDAQVTYWDQGFSPGAFGVRVGKRSKTFIVVRDGGRRVKIGTFPIISLKDARTEARRVLSERLLERNPAGIPATQALTLFLEDREKKNRPRTYRETKRILNKHLLPILQGRLLPEITTEELTEVIDDLVDDTPSEANHLHVSAKTFLNWAASRRRSYIKHSPLSGIEKPALEGERERTLSDDELAGIYLAAQKLGHPFGYIVLICIHTGLRRGEVAALKWSYVSDGDITLPGEVTKNGYTLTIPNLIADNLKLIPKTSIATEDGTPKTSEWLFPSEADTPFSAWSKNKRKFDELCGVTDWTLHDLRRTFATNMARWELASPETIDRLLNHVSGSQSKISKLYNRWHYFPQMKAALTAYERKLADLIAAYQKKHRRLARKKLIV